MTKNNVLKNLTPEEADLNEKIFDLILGRVFKKAYLDLDQDERTNMEKVFDSDDEKEKEEFIKKYVLNFKDIFKIEAKNIEEEIKTEIEKN